MRRRRSARGGAKRVVERVPGSRRLGNPRQAAHEPPAYDDGATTRPA